MQVQALLKKAAGLDIQMICPLHGPVWRNNLNYFIEKHDKWSKYEPEDQAVAIIYGSIYGNTEQAADALAAKLGAKGVKNIAVYDASKTDVSELIAEIFRVSHVVIACPTYNGGIYPPIENLLAHMKALAVLAGIKENLCYHVGRHSFASLVTLEAGVPIETISKMLGHSNIQTTQVYARVTPKKLFEDMDRLIEATKDFKLVL